MKNVSSLGLIPVFILLTLFMCSGNAGAATSYHQWQAFLVPEQGDAEINMAVHKALSNALNEFSLSHITSDVLSIDCSSPFCGNASVYELNDAIFAANAKIENSIARDLSLPNVMILYKVWLKDKGFSNSSNLQRKIEVIVKLRALDPISGAVLYTHRSGRQVLVDSLALIPDFEERIDELQSPKFVDAARIVSGQLSEQLFGQLVNTESRYQFKLLLKGYSPQETRILSSLLLPSTANIRTELTGDSTEQTFLGLTSAIQQVEYSVDSPFTPAQFRQQALVLVERMGIATNTRYVQQENLFRLERARSPYLIENTLLWFVSTVVLYLIIIGFARTIISYRLRSLESDNQTGKWIKLYKIIEPLPLPLLVSKGWRERCQGIEKRIEQSDRWFENATHLLHSYEVDSASVYVKRAIEQNASNISAVALSHAIEQQKGKNAEIKSERKEWKLHVESAVRLGQEGKIYHSLAKAYAALALCKFHENHHRPVIDLQIDSINRLLSRLVKGKSLSASGLTIQSSQQKLIVNNNQKLHIGRPNDASNLNMAIQLVLPQTNLSRIGKGIVVECDKYGYQLQDLGTKNGVWLQYVKIQQKHTHRLSALDQIHLLPPDELGSIGLEVEFVAGSDCLCLNLSQNSIVPDAEQTKSVGFLSTSTYKDTRWYLTHSDFYLLKAGAKLTWLSEEQWREKQDNELIAQSNSPNTDNIGVHLPILRMQLKPTAWIFPLVTADMATQNNCHMMIDGAKLNGPMPLQDSITLKVGEEVMTIHLHDTESIESKADEHIIHETVYASSNKEPEQGLNPTLQVGAGKGQNSQVESNMKKGSGIRAGQDVDES